MNIEEMLGKYKVREPSAGLKDRIALVTKDEWTSPGLTVEFRRSLWQMAAGLAASLLVSLTGIAVNSGLTSPGIYQGALVSTESSGCTDPEIDVYGLARLNFRAGAWHPLDLKNFVKMQKMVDEELEKGG